MDFFSDYMFSGFLYLELIFHLHGKALNFVEVITLLSHEQCGTGCAVQLSAPD